MWSRFKKIFQRGEEDTVSTAPETVETPTADPEPGVLPDVPTPTPAVADTVEARETADTFAAPAEPPPAAVPVVTSGPFRTVPVETADTFAAATEPTPEFVPKEESQPILSMDPLSDEPLSQTNDFSLETTDEAVSSGETLHPDPITGEPGAHPASVGVGALGAGAAGAVLGTWAGPIGIVVGAAIGAIAGGLAGHEVAVTPDEQAAEATGGPDPEATGSHTDESGGPSSVAGSPDTEAPLMVFPGSEFGAAEAMASGGAAAPGDFGSGFSPATVLSAPGVADGVTEETVRLAAYHLYLDRQEAGRPTDALADWYDAEREIKRF